MHKLALRPAGVGMSTRKAVREGGGVSMRNPPVLPQEMAAKAREKPTRPFVSGGSPRRTFSPAMPLAPLASDSVAAGEKGGREEAAGGRGPAPVRPWRSGGPPKQGAAFCVFSNVGRDFVPDPVPEAKVGGGCQPGVCGVPRGAGAAPPALHAALPTQHSKRKPHPTSTRPSPAQFHRKTAGEKPFRPVGSCHNRLSMRDINPYQTEARPAPDINFTLFATGG